MLMDNQLARKCLQSLALASIASASAVWVQQDALPPTSWAVISICVWLCWLVLRGWRNLGIWDKRQLIWGMCSAFALLNFLSSDPDFKGWGDVYFFCGTAMQYCTCNFRWNLLGWYKAGVLWSFVLSAALGVQRLAMQAGLNGLLPGEEVVTRESFISICWRLIPYWLNNWEQQWGAECSSMMFELPHFAVELLIILPCVQILCARMRILAIPNVNVVLPHGQDADFVRQNFSPNVLRGCWERRPEHKRLLNRLRSNKRIMLFTVSLVSLAALNALVVPLALEDAIFRHSSTPVTLSAAMQPTWHTQLTVDVAVARAMRANGTAEDIQAASAAALSDAASVQTRLHRVFDSITWPAEAAAAASDANGGSTGAAAAPAAAALAATVMERAAAFKNKQCDTPDLMLRNVIKHSIEITRMQDPKHRALVPLVECALALMRLSCEKLFVLVSVFVAYLLFRELPAPARALIRLNARLSAAFQKVILWTFPAVCWVYGAGFVFSTFVSVVFWGGPAFQCYEALRIAICTVCIKSLRPATEAEIERMGGNCAICWGEMTRQGAEPSAPAPTPLDPAAGDAAAAPAAEEAAVVEGAVLDAAVVAAAGGRSGAQSPADELAALLPEAPAEQASASAEGCSLPCGHSFHHACLSQWLQQCHGQGVTPTCPMCQQTIQLEVTWRFPWPWRSRHADADNELVAARQQPMGAGGDNFLLQQHPLLAELLQDMPQLMVPENAAMAQEVQELQQQRQQLIEELQLRQQQLRELAGRQQRMQREGMEMEQQRTGLLAELELLRRARRRQRRRQRLQRANAVEHAGAPAGAAPTDAQHAIDDDAGASGDEASDADEADVVLGLRAAGAGGIEGGGHAELRRMLDAFMEEQERGPQQQQQQRRRGVVLLPTDGAGNDPAAAGAARRHN